MLALTAIALAIAGCARPARDALQDDMIAHPEKYMPSNARAGLPSDVGRARTAGAARGTDLGLARACGANPASVLSFATLDPAPAGSSPEGAAAYRAAITERARGERQKPPAPPLCDAMRARSDFANLFPPLPSPARGSRATPAPAAVAAASGQPGPNEPAYCSAASAVLLDDANPDRALPLIQARCRTGDSVIFPTYATGVIASACDMTKPINTAGPNVYCTLGRVRAMRRE